MQGSKRSARRSWYRSRDENSLRGEIKYSLRKNKKYLNRKVRHCKDLPSGSAYKKLAKDKSYEYVTWCEIVFLSYKKDKYISR